MARLTKNVVDALLRAARTIHAQRTGHFTPGEKEREYLAKGIEWLEAKQRDRVEA